MLYPLGRVGSGLPHAQRDALLQVLRSTERDTCPFSPAPTGPDVRRTRWVEPALCVQVRYLNVTPDGVLRQPVLIALRPDVTPIEAPTANSGSPYSSLCRPANTTGAITACAFGPKSQL